MQIKLEKLSVWIEYDEFDHQLILIMLSSPSTHPSLSAQLSSSLSSVHVVQENPETMFVSYLRTDLWEKSPQSCWWKQFNINITQL